MNTEPITELKTQNSKLKTESRVLRSFGILLSTQLVTWVLTSVYIIITPRYLGPTNQGRLTLAYAVINILAIFIELGMVKLLTREVARDHAQAGPMLSVMLLWRLVTGSLAFVGLAVAVNVLDYPATYRPLFYVVGLTMIFQLLAGSFTPLFQAVEQFKYAAWQDITVKALMLILVALVIVTGGDVGLVAFAATVAWVVATVQGWVWSRRFAKINLRVPLGQIKNMAWQSLPFWGTAVMLVIYTYIDALLLSILSSETAVGWYAAPTRLFTTAMFLPAAMGTAIFPALSRLFVSDQPAMVELAGQNLRWLITGSLPITVLVITLSPNVIPLLFGDEFGPSVPVMAILGLTLFSTYINTVVNQFLVAANRQLEWTKVMVAATILNPLINLALISYFNTQGNGAIGAAWSLFITETLMLIPAFLLMPRGILSRAVVGKSLRVALACLPMAAVCWWLHDLFFVIPALAGLATFALFAFALRAVSLKELVAARKLLVKS